MVKAVRTAFEPVLRCAVQRGVGRFARAELLFPACTAPVVPLAARERLPPRQPPPRYQRPRLRDRTRSDRRGGARRTASQRRCRRRNVPWVGWGRSLSALALESQRPALAHHLRRRSICGGEARDGWVGQQINVRRGRVISLGHVGKLQQGRLARGLPHDLRLAAPPPGDRRSRHRGSLSGTTPR